MARHTWLREDAKLHYIVVYISSGMLGLVILIIFLNDRPFLGEMGIEPGSYIQASWIISEDAHDLFKAKPLKEACDLLVHSS